MIFDTHAHYDDSAFDSDRYELLRVLPETGIGRVVVPATGPDNIQAVVQLASQVEYIYAAVGIHPHEAAHADRECLAALARLLEQGQGAKIVAVGECGLDYHYDHAPRPIQKDVFDAQLSMARKAGLPVIVHDREAHADCLDMLRAHPGCCGVFHCYSGSAEMVAELVKLDFMISFTGSVTFKNAHKLRAAAAAVPEERLMVETDAPYMAPVPHRGKRCDSRMIPHIFDVLAEARGTSPAALEQLTWDNANRFFGLE